MNLYVKIWIIVSMFFMLVSMYAASNKKAFLVILSCVWPFVVAKNFFVTIYKISFVWKWK